MRVEELDDLLDSSSQLLKNIPYIGTAIRAYRWLRVKRLESFLKGLDTVASELSPDDRVRFETYMHSAEGTELLAEYMDSVVRSRSETVNAALALFYADRDDVVYSADVKADAALALEGIAERTIDAFLLIVRHRQLLSTGQDSAFSLNDADGPFLEPLARWSSRGREWVGIPGPAAARNRARAKFI